MKVSTDFSCNYIIWLSNGRDTDVGPTCRMTGNVEAVLQKVGMHFEHIVIESSDHLDHVLDTLERCTRESNLLPLIHIDMHGSNDEGLEINGSSGAYSWEKLSKKFQAINVAAKNNLTVVGACCHALSAIKFMSIKEPAPFFALLAPPEKVSIGFLEANISSFYEQLFESGHIDEAFEKTLAEKFELFISERLLANSIAGYIRKYCKGKTKDKRREYLLTKVLEEGLNNTPANRKLVRKLAKEGLAPDENLMNRYAETFLISREFGFTFEQLLEVVESNVT